MPRSLQSARCMCAATCVSVYHKRCVRVCVLCVWAQRAWPAWKCDLILINDNHMEHDWMIYGTTPGNNRRLQAGRRWKRSFTDRRFVLLMRWHTWKSSGCERRRGTRGGVVFFKVNAAHEEKWERDALMHKFFNLCASLNIILLKCSSEPVICFLLLRSCVERNAGCDDNLSILAPIKESLKWRKIERE